MQASKQRDSSGQAQRRNAHTGHFSCLHYVINHVGSLWIQQSKSPRGSSQLCYLFSENLQVLFICPCQISLLYKEVLCVTLLFQSILYIVLVYPIHTYPLNFDFIYIVRVSVGVSGRVKVLVVSMKQFSLGKPRGR